MTPSLPQIITTYKPTVEELHRGEYEIEGETLILDLLDTSGTHQFPAMRELAIRQSDVILLVWSIDNAASWELLASLREEVGRYYRLVDNGWLLTQVVGFQYNICVSPTRVFN